jgi:5-formyltetrahydrofolate cyclo-ligase
VHPFRTGLNPSAPGSSFGAHRGIATRLPYGVSVQSGEDSTAAAKASLRTTLIAARRARTSAERLAARAAITAHLVVALDGTGSVAAYLPLPTEPLDTGLLDLLATRTRVLVPVVTGSAPLDWCAFPGPVRHGALGIAEPVGPRLGADAIDAADAVLVPALAVDPAGHRLGRGGGHYDRTIALLTRLRGRRPMPDLIAVIYDEELLAAVPGDDLDQRVTAVVTPERGLRALG